MLFLNPAALMKVFIINTKMLFCLFVYFGESLCILFIICSLERATFDFSFLHAFDFPLWFYCSKTPSIVVNITGKGRNQYLLADTTDFCCRT